MRTYPSWLHAELINWARWCWMGDYPGPTPQTTCVSFEKHWRPTEWESDPDDRGRTFVDEDMALNIDLIWRKLPATPRLILRAAYPKRYLYETPQEAAKEAGVKMSEWEEELNRAAWLVAEKLGAGSVRGGSAHGNGEVAHALRA